MPVMLTLIDRLLRRGPYGAPITVVSRLPRSGTSMAMKMVEAVGMALAGVRYLPPYSYHFKSDRSR
jgi:hypothetical protein